MSDYFDTDLPWDDEEQLIDREPETGGRHGFGHFKMYSVNVTRVFEKGKFFVIPGVQGSDFKEKDPNGNMKFGGWRLGGDRKLYVLVVTKLNQEGQPYQIVKQYKGKPDRANEEYDWGDFVYPEIQKLPVEQRRQLLNTGLFVEYDELPTGRSYNDNPINYYGNFVVYADEDTMRKAETEFFAQFSNGDTATSESKDYYPEKWQADVDGMIAIVKQWHSEGKPLQEIAENTMLIINGQAARTASGEEVPVKQVLSEILDLPEPMIDVKYLEEDKVPY